jgi:hypothetical protein
MPSRPLDLDEVPLGPVAAHVDVCKVKDEIATEANLAIERAAAAKTNDAIPELDVSREKLVDGLLRCASIEEGSKLTHGSSNVSRIEVKTAPA